MDIIPDLMNTMTRIFIIAAFVLVPIVPELVFAILPRRETESSRYSEDVGLRSANLTYSYCCFSEKSKMDNEPELKTAEESFRQG